MPKAKKSPAPKTTKKKVGKPAKISKKIAATSVTPLQEQPLITGREAIFGSDVETGAQTPRTFNENHPYWHVINQVIDPELGVGIADMGIVYDVQQKNGVVDVKMTLTSMGCPAGPDIVTNLDAVLRMEPGVKDVAVEVVWDPMWTPDMMKPELREMLMGGVF